MSNGADLADMAEKEIETFMRVSLINSRQDDGPAYIGRCYACGNALEEPKRWCDELCRDDYESERDARKRSGPTMRY